MGHRFGRIDIVMQAIGRGSAGIDRDLPRISGRCRGRVPQYLWALRSGFHATVATGLITGESAPIDVEYTVQSGTRVTTRLFAEQTTQGIVDPKPLIPGVELPSIPTLERSADLLIVCGTGNDQAAELLPAVLRDCVDTSRTFAIIGAPETSSSSSLFDRALFRAPLSDRAGAELDRIRSKIHGLVIIGNFSTELADLIVPSLVAVGKCPPIAWIVQEVPPHIPTELQGDLIAFFRSSAPNFSTRFKTFLSLLELAA